MTKLTPEDKVKWKRNFRFIAPEIIDGTSPASEATDVYSFGYLIHCVLAKTKRNKELEELKNVCMAQPTKRASLVYVIVMLRNALC